MPDAVSLEGNATRRLETSDRLIGLIEQFNEDLSAIDLGVDQEAAPGERQGPRGQRSGVRVRIDGHETVQTLGRQTD